MIPFDLIVILGCIILIPLVVIFLIAEGDISPVFNLFFMLYSIFFVGFIIIMQLTWPLDEVKYFDIKTSNDSPLRYQYIIFNGEIININEKMAGDKIYGYLEENKKVKLYIHKNYNKLISTGSKFRVEFFSTEVDSGRLEK